MVGMAWDRVRGARYLAFPTGFGKVQERKKEKKKGEKGGKKGRQERKKERPEKEKEKKRNYSCGWGGGKRRGMLDRPGYFCIKKCFQFYQLKLSQGL